jgi:ribosomal protein S18 acetylase RimI-like enzyme
VSEPIEVRDAGPEDAAWIRESMIDVWQAPVVAVHDELIEVTTLPGLIAWQGGQRIGLLVYRVDATDGNYEVVSLHAAVPGLGAGGGLLAAAAHRARAAGAHRIWLVTTNENTAALRFYQRQGWDLVAVHRGAVDRARLLKPTIPRVLDGIAVRHELELELLLADSG